MNKQVKQKNKSHLSDKIIEHINHPLLAIDREGYLVYANEAAKEILYLEPKCKKKWDINQCFQCNEKVQYLCRLMREAIKKEMSHIQEIELDGRIYAVSINPIIEEGLVGGASAIIHDITEIRQQERQNLLLYNIAITMASHLPTREALERILHKIVEIMNVTGGTVMLVNKQAGTLCVEATTAHESTNPLNLKMGEGMAGWVAKTGQPLATPFTRKDKYYIPRSDNELNRSLLVMPLISKGEILGILNLHKPAGEYFTETEVQTYSSIASRVATVLDNGRLRHQGEERLKLAQILDSTLELRPALKETAYKVAEIMESGHCAILLWQEEGPLTGYACTDDKVNIENIRINVTADLAKILLSNLEQTNEVSKCKRFAWIRQLTKQLGWEDGNIFPLVSKGSLIGLLILHNPEAIRIYSYEEKALGNEICSQIAKSIENANLFEKVKWERNVLDTIQQTTSEGLILLNESGKTILYNSKAKELLGLRHSLIGKHIAEIGNQEKFFRHNFDVPKNFGQILTMKIDRNETFSLIFKTIEGPKRVLWGEMKPVRSELGMHGFLFSVRNITELQRLQEKMATRVHQLTHLYSISSLSELDYRQTVNKTVGILPHLLQAENSIFALYNKNKEEFVIISEVKWGRSQRKVALKDSPIGKWLLENRRPILAPQNIKLDKSNTPALLDKVKSLLSVPIVSRGELIGILSVANKKEGLFTKEDLKLLSIVGSQIATQIENYRLWESLANEKKQLTTIIDDSADGIAVVNGKGEITLSNNALERLIGYEKGEIVGQPAAKILKSKDDSPLMKLIKRKKSNNKGNFFEAEIATKNGPSRWVLVHYSFLPNVGTESLDTLVMFNDISRYKELEEAKNEFISTATHELRTPLTAVKGYLSMIIQGDAGHLNDRQEKFFSRAFQSSERLSNLVEELLNVIRLEQKRVSFHYRPTNLLQLTNETALDFSQKAKEKGIALSIKSMNEAIEKVRVLADPDRTKQVLSNLVDNALKYTPEGGRVDIKLAIEEKNGKEILVTSVEDNGVGIPQNQLDRLFNKFERLVNPLTRQVSGYGLGLFIAKSLIDQQGGQIWATSAPGRGSKFAFYLPVIS